jgi:hypothetical protein
MVVTGQPHQMNKKVMAKGYCTLTSIGLTKGFGKRVAIEVGWPHWMNKKRFQQNAGGSRA